MAWTQVWLFYNENNVAKLVVDNVLCGKIVAACCNYYSFKFK